MNQERVNELLNSIEAFSKESFYKEEVLPECFKLQDELVKLVFAEEHAEYGHYRLNDVLNHFRQKNEELGHVADPELSEFEADSNDMTNEIKGRISGERGEQKVFRALENLKVSHRIMKNVEFTTPEGERTEIDAVVITPKGVFIVEVKNTSRDIFIDDKGDYYRTGRYNRFDSHIGEKMECKERLLRNALQKQGLTNINIEKLVVFTNSQIEVANEYESLQICFLSQLCYKINSYRGESTYSEETMRRFEESIEQGRCKEEYPIDVNVDKLKYDFAVVMATLEAAAQCEEEQDEVSEADSRVETWADHETEKAHPKYLQYVSGFVAAASVTVMVATLANVIRR